MSIILRVKELIKKHKDNYPDDEWISLGKYYDLNLFTSDGEKKATIHPVVHGHTMTDTGLEIIV